MSRVREQHLTGSAPVVIEPGLLTPIGDEEWKGRIRWLRFDGTRADFVECGPHAYAAPPFLGSAAGTGTALLTIVVDGATVGVVGGREVALRRGQAALTRGGVPFAYRAARSCRMLRILVDERHLTDAPPASEAPFALLKDSPLVTACAGFISGLLQLGNEHVAAQDEPAVGQSLVALYASLLDEALHRTAASTSSGRIDRRLQIEQHIGQHLADPELSPRGIAESLGVSVRTVHAAFADGPDGVAAHIRARRVEMAKALLVQRVEPPHVPSLARSVGLTPAVLSRAFAAGTGLTVREWWRRAAEPERPSGS